MVPNVTAAEINNAVQVANKRTATIKMAQQCLLI